jgi:hypothetical protein
MSGIKNQMSKTRNWAFVIYPESAPNDWMDILINTHIPILVSPLHDRDEAEDGLPKKPHYHVVIMMDGPITKKRADEIIEPFCGTKSAEYIKSLRGYVRYLAHLDDPDKAQYDPSDIIALSGADLGKLLELGRPTDSELLSEIIVFCKQQGIREFADLTIYAQENRSKDWLEVISKKAFFFATFLKSSMYSERERQQPKNTSIYTLKNGKKYS